MHALSARSGSLLSAIRKGAVALGGAEGNRTLYLLHAMQALSQMSYSPGVGMLNV